LLYSYVEPYCIKLTTNTREREILYASFICSTGKEKGGTKTKRNGKRKGDMDKEAGNDGSRLLCLPVWHVPGSHDVNQRTCLSRGRELFLRQVQRSISRGMIDAPAACNSPRISSPRMRKLHDRENDLYKPRMSQTFRIFFFSRLINPFKIIP